MRGVLLFSLCLVPLALGNTFVQPAPAPRLEEEHKGFDLVKVMHDLFTDRQDRAISNEDENADEAVKEDGDAKASLTPVTDKNSEKKYNQMVDGIYQGMNQKLKSNGLDPMVLDLEKAKARTAAMKAKKEAKKDAKRSHSVEKRDITEDEPVEDSVAEAEAAESDLTEEARKMKMNPKHKAVTHAKKNKKNMNKKNKHMKKNKDEKNMKKGDAKKEEKKKDGKKEEKKKDGKKGGKKEHKKDGKKEHKKEDNKDQKKEDNKDEKKHQNKNKNKKHHSKKNENKKHHHTKRDANKNKKNNENKHKEMGSLSGIASLKRHGDVKVFKNSEGHEIIHSEFFIGPLSLEVSKSTHGHGKSKNVKVARAVTEKLKGKMVLKVKSDGSTTVKSVHFEKPQQVNVRGSLNMKSSESKNLAEKSYARLRPVAAQRLLKIAKSIVKNKTTVEKQ